MWEWVVIGGALGAAARWQASAWVLRRFPVRWPLGTFAVNVIGAFLLGVLANRFAAGSTLGMLFETGFLGAFTTFSTFSYEVVSFIQLNEWKKAISYALLSLVIGVLACWIGISI